jgi:hypothetical protein
MISFTRDEYEALLDSIDDARHRSPDQQSAKEKIEMYLANTFPAVSPQMPVGHMFPFADAQQGVVYGIYDGHDMLVADGQPLPPNRPELHALLIHEMPRPKFELLHPIRSLRAQRAWDATDDHREPIYGGTVEQPNLPDMRAYQTVSHDMEV